MPHFDLNFDCLKTISYFKIAFCTGRATKTPSQPFVFLLSTLERGDIKSTRQKKTGEIEKCAIEVCRIRKGKFAVICDTDMSMNHCEEKSVLNCHLELPINILEKCYITDQEDFMKKTLHQ